MTAADNALHRRRVLLIEDEPFSSRVTAKQLERMGVGAVVLAPHGAEGVFQAKTQPFDLVICDWNMPVISGLDVLHALRAARPALPFLMLTARGDDDSAAVARMCGATAFLTKPCHPKELEATVRRLTEASPRYSGR
jgi:DNA-binding response OmpR family regulator